MGGSETDIPKTHGESERRVNEVKGGHKNETQILEEIGIFGVHPCWGGHLSASFYERKENGLRSGI